MMVDVVVVIVDGDSCRGGGGIQTLVHLDIRSCVTGERMSR